jgi:anti-sigma regulatory factor (Ser/Thr protein kinase)
MKKFIRTYAAVTGSLNLIRTDTNLFLTKECRLKNEEIIDVNIVVGEVLQNIFRYEYPADFLLGKIKLEIEVAIHAPPGARGTLNIKITDDAPKLEDLAFLERKITPSELGGMGISFIRQLTKEYKIYPTSSGNEHLIIM